VKFDNLPFSKPNAIWAQFGVRHLSHTIEESGNSKTSEKRGLLEVEIFAPVDSGVAESYELAAEIVARYEATELMGVTFDTPYSRRLGETQERDGYVTLVTVPFRFYSESVQAALVSGPMADIQDFLTTIRTRFRTLVATPESLPTKYDNLPFTKPSSLSTIWCEWRISPGETVQIELGDTKTFRTPGTATATLHGPIGEGESAMHALVDKIDAAFRAVSEGVVDFEAPHPPQGRREDGHWVIDVVCPWEADRTTEAA